MKLLSFMIIKVATVRSKSINNEDSTHMEVFMIIFNMKSKDLGELGTAGDIRVYQNLNICISTNNAF